MISAADKTADAVLLWEKNTVPTDKPVVDEKYTRKKKQGEQAVSTSG